MPLSDVLGRESESLPERLRRDDYVLLPGLLGLAEQPGAGTPQRVERTLARSPPALVKV